MHITRRGFIRMGSLTTAGLPFLSLMQNGHIIENSPKRSVEEGQEIYNLFKDPDASFRPFVRWWWNGDRLEKAEILRELDLLKAGGIGGMEINPIRFPDNADPVGVNSLEWLSDEWIDMLEVALKGAKERGLICDMIVGSGWPFGGEFLSRDDQSQMIALGTKNLAGGQRHTLLRQELLDSVNPDFHSKYRDKIKELTTVKLAPLNLQHVAQITDFSDQVKNNEVEITVPDGEHVLYYLVKITGFMAVINGAPGAGGPVLNHYSKPAVERYFKRMSDRLTGRIGPLGNYFRAFFTDSLELEGANWCDDLFEEFRKRKGYDLAPYFPLILFKVGEMGNAAKDIYGSKLAPQLQQFVNRVRYDFEDTRVALFKERFIDTFVGWCKENGIKSRMQAYGRECNPLEAGMLIDIPECETWLSKTIGEEFSDTDYRRGRAYTMNNKYVSSSAHLTGTKIISCEEMTNTGMVFNATLELIKIAGDQSILSGVTHSVLHGFNYSPLKAPFPGWVRYGTFFNERNTWWPYVRQWTDYKARLYALLQQAEMQADIALLPPLADLSAKFGFQRDPFPSFAYPTYVYQVWEAIHQTGCGCDYVTENIIQQATFKNGSLVYGPRSYKTLMLIDVESLLPATVTAIKQFTSSGGTLICVEKSPASSPTNQGAKDKDPAKQINVLEPNNRRTGIVPAPQRNFIQWFERIKQQYNIEPHVTIHNPDPFVSQVHYKVADLDIFFFSNYNSTREHSLKAKFRMKGKKIWIWDPETGKRFLYSAGENDEVLIPLAPCESRLVILDTEGNGEKYLRPQFNNEAATKISNPWKVTLNGVDGKSAKITMDKLMDFSQHQDLKTFAGTAIYENTFYATGNGSFRYLSLGQTHGISEIEINNQKIGTQWYGTPVHEISKHVKAGVNTIRIRFTTTLGNYMKSLKDNKVAQEWTGNQPLFPVGLIGPVRLL